MTNTRIFYYVIGVQRTFMKNVVLVSTGEISSRLIRFNLFDFPTSTFKRTSWAFVDIVFFFRFKAKFKFYLLLALRCVAVRD